MNTNILLQLMGRTPEEEQVEQETALRRMMASVKKPIPSNEVPTRSELPFDQAYKKENLPPAVYKKKVTEAKAKQLAYEAEQKALREAELAKYEDKAVPLSVKNGESNLQEAMNPTTAKNVVNQIMRERINSVPVGGKRSTSGSQNNFVSEGLNDQFITNVDKASTGLGLGAFDQNYTVPELRKLKEGYEKEITKQEGRTDNSQGVWNAMIAAGYNPVKDFDKVYKFDAASNIAGLKEKIAKLVIDQGKSVGDTEKYKATLYANQRLPNTNWSDSLAQQMAGKGSGSGAGKPPTEKALEDYGKDFAKLQKTRSAEKRIMQLVDNIDMDVVNAYAISGTGASMLNRIKGFTGGKAATAKSQATEEAISLLADIMLNNQLELSGKAATDKEQARIMISSGISAGSSKGGAKTGIQNIFNDFKRQLATPLAGRSRNLKQAFDQESGLNSTQEVQDALSSVSADRIQQVDPPPGVGGSTPQAPAAGGDLFGAGASEWLKNHRANKGQPK